MTQTAHAPFTTGHLSEILSRSMEAKLSGSALRVLAALQEAKDGNRPPLTPTWLAAHLGCSIAGTTGLIDRLTNRFLITRTHSTEDRRQLLITITPAGTETLNRILAA